MSLLTVCEALALNVGMQKPTSVIGSAEREHEEMLQFAHEAGEELARRVDWGELTKIATITGDGAQGVTAFPADFSRMVRHNGVRVGAATVRPLNRAEWNTLEQVEGTPRYYLLEDGEISLWPYLATGSTATAYYQSKEWTSVGEAFTADTDTSLINEDLLTKGLIARWRRQKGMDYADQEAEYEAALADHAQFDGSARV